METLSTLNVNTFEDYSTQIYNHSWFFWMAALFYIVMINKLPIWMKDRQPMSIKPIIFTWNVLIAVFSFYGAKNTLIRKCDSDWSEDTSFWIAAYIWSKVPEMLDTLWLILRKKNVIFLHSWHHVSVAIIMWHNGAYNPNDNLAAICMGLNYSVHTIMYSYYALSTIGIRPPYPQAITIAQISQFVLGLSVPFWEDNYPYCRSNHSITTNHRKWNRNGCSMIAFSYLVLFIHYYIKRYVVKVHQKKIDNGSCNDKKIF